MAGAKLTRPKVRMASIITENVMPLICLHVLYVPHTPPLTVLVTQALRVAPF